MAQPNDGNCCLVFNNCCGDDALTRKWNVISGSWGVGSNILTPSGAGLLTAKQSLCRCNQILIQVTTTGFGSVGEKFRLIFGYVDSSTYKYVEWELLTLPSGPSSSGTYSVTYGENGSPIQVVILDTEVGLSFTNLDDTYFICITEDNIHMFPNIVFTTSGLTGGIAGLQHLNGSITYSGFIIRRYVGYDNVNGSNILGPYCSKCRIGCEQCIDFKKASQVKIELSGVVDSLSDSLCLTCSSLNGTYYLDNIGGCVWEGETGHGCIDTIRYIVGVGSIIVQFSFGGGAGFNTRFSKTITNPHNCYDSYTNESFSPFAGATQSRCDTSGATCLVSYIN